MVARFPDFKAPCSIEWGAFLCSETLYELLALGDGHCSLDAAVVRALATA